MTRRDWVTVITLAAIGILTAAPGVHVFEIFLPRMPATVVSHGIAAVLLGLAIYQWRVRRARSFVNDNGV